MAVCLILRLLDNLSLIVVVNLSQIHMVLSLVYIVVFLNLISHMLVLTEIFSKLMQVTSHCLSLIL